MIIIISVIIIITVIITVIDVLKYPLATKITTGANFKTL